MTAIVEFHRRARIERVKKESFSKFSNTIYCVGTWIYC